MDRGEGLPPLLMEGREVAAERSANPQAGGTLNVGMRMPRLMALGAAIGVIPGCGLVGFSYPLYDETSPLKDPVKVAEVRGGVLHLEDGRRVRPLIPVPEARLREALAASEYEVEFHPVRHDPDGTAVALIRVKFGPLLYCGTPWAQPIRIPLFPERLPKWIAMPLDRVPP